MMGATTSLLNCGLLEVLVGDPDWTIDANGIRHSAARRARAQSELEQKVRDDILQRESRCAQYEAEIAEHTRNAQAAGRLARTPTTAPKLKATAMARAKHSLQLMAQTQQRLARERTIVQKARASLTRISVVQRGDDDRRLFENLNALTRGVELTDAKLEALEVAGESVVDGHERLGELEAALDKTVGMFDQSLAADGGSSEFDLNDESQLFAALAQLDEQQPPPPTPAPTPVAAATNSGAALVHTAPAPPTYVPYQHTVDTRVAVTTDGRAHARVRRDNLDDAF